QHAAGALVRRPGRAAHGGGLSRLSVEPFPATATLHGLAESLSADMHALQAAMTAQHWEDVAELAHRIRGVVACTRADAGIDQACLVLELQARRGPQAGVPAMRAQHDRLAARLQGWLAAQP